MNQKQIIAETKLPDASQQISGAKAGQILVLSFALICVITMGGLGLLAYAWKALDQYEAVQETALAERTVQGALDRMAAETASATSWDEAYAHTRGPINLNWIERHLAVYYASSFDHRFTIVFDSAGNVVFGAVNGRFASPWRYQSIAASTAPLAREVQAKEWRRRSGVEAPGPPESGNVVWRSAFVRDDKQVHLVGVSTLAPNSGNALGPNKAVTVVTGVTLGARYLATLQNAANLHDLRLSLAPGGGLGSANLKGADGKAVASVVWRVRRPGADIVKAGAWVFISVATLLAVIIAALGRHIRILFRQLRFNDVALRLTMDELIVARDRAQASSVAKSRFIANMSHEVRTPLNGVLGMAQALARDDLSPAQSRRVETILRSGEGLLAVLNDILDISKIEAGHLEISRAAFDLSELVRATCLSYEDVARAKGLTVSAAFDPLVGGRWLGDPARIRQILLNLLSNAIKFSESGRVRVEVGRREGMINIVVADDGIGIPANKIDRLFEKFSQVDASSTRRRSGAGLGLAISRELAVLMEGDIDAVSVEGVGSQFTLRLPLSPAPNGAAPEMAIPAPQPASLKILAAEDNETNRLVLEALLEPLGGKLDFVADGSEAVDRFEVETYDLILMDIQMPVMNGIDATRLIRAKESREKWVRTPILALTANTLESQLLEYAEAGIDGHVAKPVQTSSLYAAIIQALDHQD